MSRLIGRALASVLLTALSAMAGAPARAPAEAELRAVLVAPADGGSAALTSRVLARVARNQSGTPSVGLFASSAATPGDQWLATLWQAAFVATGATHSSLLDSEFSLRVGEPLLDGSAGLLTASTLAALIRGKKLLPHTSLVGALNPDGSAGPVGDVLPRLRAAAADGLKRFGLPLGARQQLDATGERVDVVLEGQRLGVEVKELAGLDDAYLFLTGEALPRPAAASEAEMELWPAELAAMRRLTAQVRGELDQENTALNAALDAGVSPASATAVRARVERSARQAADFESGGDPVRAFVVWSATLTLVRAALQDRQLLAALEARDTEAALAQLRRQAEALPTERLALRHEVDVRFPAVGRANDLYALDVLESIVTQGSAFRAEEDAAALRSGAADPVFAPRVRAVAEALLRGREDLKNGQRFVTLYASLPPLKKTLAPLDAERLASSYAAAGAAWRASFLAALSPAAAQDPTSAELRGYEVLLRTETDPRARLVLASRQHLFSAYLLNLYGALGAQVSDKGVLTLRNPRVLSSQLEHARLRVLQACGRAKREAGMVPLAARLRYLNARAAREGSERQKAESLADLWVANWWCELAVTAPARAR